MTVPSSDYEAEKQELEAEIQKTQEFLARGRQYLEEELETALKQKGEDVKVTRLLRGIQERLKEATLMEAALRRARSAGLAPAPESRQKDFGSILEAKRAEKKRSAS